MKDENEERFHRVFSVKVAQTVDANAREEAAVDITRLQDALAMLYDKWENGTPAYQSIDDSDLGGYLGNAFTLTWEEENEVLALLKDVTRAATSKTEDK